jgi:ATP-dependent RNA helicase RhlE
LTTFKDFGFAPGILKSLEESGYVTPTPIQAKAIPLVLDNQDVLACAQTGTGKTAAFSLPIINNLSAQEYDKHNRKIRCLIVTPTRELAVQIEECITAYSKHTDLRSTVIFGGVPQGAQVRKLNSGIDILIATPGRLLDLMGQGYIKLNNVGVFILDEADRMLDMGFINDIKKLVKVIPSKRQTLLFSATMPNSILSLAKSLLHQPHEVKVDPVSSTADTIQQKIYFVDKPNKIWLLIDIIKEHKMDAVLVFTRTKHGADKVVRMLEKNKITSAAIHGNKSQNARQRALKHFKEGSVQALIATDIAARGIDIDSLKFVVNYDLPNEEESYVHRIGRTGRAGKDGQAFSFCDIDEKAYLKDIQKLIKQEIPVVEDHAFPLQNFTLSPKKQQGGGRRHQGGGGGNGKSQGQGQGNSGARQEKRKKWFGKKR